MKSSKSRTLEQSTNSPRSDEFAKLKFALIFLFSNDKKKVCLATHTFRIS